MAKIGYIIIPEGFDESYYKNLQIGDRFVYPNLRRKPVFYSWKKRKNLTKNSLLPIISTEWKNLTTSQKDAWNVSGQFTDLNGWRLFVSDMVNRIKAGMTGVATPSIHHQSRVGCITLEGSADHIKIAQYHPQTYWINSKVAGTKNKYIPTLVREDFSLPLEIGISYKTNLTPIGSDPFARFYAVVYSLYQGLTLETVISLDFDLVSNWQTVTATISEVVGQPIFYTLFIESFNLHGTIFFDNIKATHNSQNWCRGWQCNTIDTIFTRAFYQIPRFWAPISLPDGASYFSIYPPDDV